MRKLNKEQLRNIAWGACLLGSGGGGALKDAEHFLDALPAVWSVDVVTADEVKANEIAAIVAYIGAPSALDAIHSPKGAFYAFDELQTYIGQPIRYLIPVEIGPVSTLVACITAGAKGVPVVDADGAGRAVPSLTMLTFALLSSDPLVLASEDKVETVLKTSTATSAEQLVRAIISAPCFKSIAGLGIWPMTNEKFEEVLPIRGTLETCESLGAILRAQPFSHGNLLCALEASGYPTKILTEGRVTTSHSQLIDGHDIGSVEITQDNGVKITIYTENENLIAWRSDRDTPLVMAPDLACYVTDKGRPYSNADFGTPLPMDTMFLLGAAAPESLLRTDIMAAFRSALADTGYPGAYVPLAKLVKNEAQD